MKTFKELINICNEAVKKESKFEVNIVTSEKLPKFVKYDEERFSHKETVLALTPEDAFNKISEKYNINLPEIFNAEETKTDKENYLKIDASISSDKETKTYFIYIKKSGFDDSNVMLDDE